MKRNREDEDDEEEEKPRGHPPVPTGMGDLMAELRRLIVAGVMKVWPCLY
jgi:hypothetical protein